MEADLWTLESSTCIQADKIIKHGQHIYILTTDDLKYYIDLAMSTVMLCP